MPTVRLDIYNFSNVHLSAMCHVIPLKERARKSVHLIIRICKLAGSCRWDGKVVSAVGLKLILRVEVVPIDTLIENAAFVLLFRSINSHHASIFLKLVESRWDWRDHARECTF